MAVTPPQLGDDQYAEVTSGYADVQVRVRNVIVTTAIIAMQNPSDASLGKCAELTRLMVDRVQRQIG